ARPRARRTTFSRAGASIDDAEVREVARETSPAGVDTVDPRGAGALLGPAVELADRLFFAFREDLHGSVAAIFHPAAEPEALRLALRGRAEVHALDAAPDDQL